MTPLNRYSSVMKTAARKHSPAQVFADWAAFYKQTCRQQTTVTGLQPITITKEIPLMV